MMKSTRDEMIERGHPVPFAQGSTLRAPDEVQIFLTGEPTLLDAKGDRERYRACELASVGRNPRPGCGKANPDLFLRRLLPLPAGLAKQT
jgi:hypothetical protein